MLGLGWNLTQVSSGDAGDVTYRASKVVDSQEAALRAARDLQPEASVDGDVVMPRYLLRSGGSPEQLPEPPSESAPRGTPAGEVQEAPEAAPPAVKKPVEAQETAEKDEGASEQSPDGKEFPACCLLRVDDKLFGFAAREAIPDKAWPLIEATYRQRVQSAAADAWSIAPEPQLLERLGDTPAGRMAEELLNVRLDSERQRAKLLGEQVNLESALRPKKVTFEEARNVMAMHVAGMAGERLEHMQRWKQLSHLAPWFLGASFIFSALMVIVVWESVTKGQVDALAAALIIFVLAVFAAGPAVLLLLERPLEGIDKWRPAGAEDKPKEPSAAASDPGAKTATPEGK
jgi:hypothetical protein